MKDFLLYILSVIKDYNKIVIIGMPASGKTSFTDELMTHMELENHTCFRTDNFINDVKSNFKEALYDMMPLIIRQSRHLVEGVQGFRLVRKGVQRGNYTPDLIIYCTASKEERRTRYKKREGKDYAGNDGVYESIWNDYTLHLSLSPDKPRPRIIFYNTETGEYKDKTWVS